MTCHISFNVLNNQFNENLLQHSEAVRAHHELCRSPVKVQIATVVLKTDAKKYRKTQNTHCGNEAQLSLLFPGCFPFLAQQLSNASPRAKAVTQEKKEVFN